MSVEIIHRPLIEKPRARRHAAIDSIRINEVRREKRAGRDVWVKTRKPAAALITRCANIFFRLAKNPVRVLSDARQWQQREIACFDKMHGKSFRARTENEHTVIFDHIDGANLCDELEKNRLTDAMLEAAARELARTHAMIFETQCFSHGDARLANFLFDETESRARLIDFEVEHRPQLSAPERHADDLLVFLQDLMGRLSDERWLPDALRFLRAYENRETIDTLKNRLDVPRSGAPRLWWSIRTRYTPRAVLARRCESLRKNLP